MTNKQIERCPARIEAAEHVEEVQEQHKLPHSIKRYILQPTQDPSDLLSQFAKILSSIDRGGAKLKDYRWDHDRLIVDVEWEAINRKRKENKQHEPTSTNRKQDITRIRN